MMSDKRLELQTRSICTVVTYFDQERTQPAEFVRRANGRYEAVVPTPAQDDHLVLGAFDEQEQALKAILAHNPGSPFRRLDGLEKLT